MGEKSSDLVVIKQFFFDGAPVRDAAAEMKELTDGARRQLAEGIRNGTFTY